MKRERKKKKTALVPSAKFDIIDMVNFSFQSEIAPYLQTIGGKEGVSLALEFNTFIAKKRLAKDKANECQPYCTPDCPCLFHIPKRDS